MRGLRACRRTKRKPRQRSRPELAAGFFDLEAALESDSSFHLSCRLAVNDGDTAAFDDAAGRQPYADIFTHIREDAEASP